MTAQTGSAITTYFRVCDGVRIRFAYCKAESETTVLLLAPWPETVWAFRRIWGRVSSVGRLVAIEMYLDDLLPNSEIHPLEAGHFAWEQAPDEYARLIADWIGGGYRRVTGTSSAPQQR